MFQFYYDNAWIPETYYLIGIRQKFYRASESNKFMIEFQKWYIYPKFTFLTAQIIKQLKLFPAQITTHKRQLIKENIIIQTNHQEVRIFC